jgi:peptidyl-prolyl cis-trans isomerase C
MLSMRWHFLFLFCCLLLIGCNRGSATETPFLPPTGALPNPTARPSQESTLALPPTWPPEPTPTQVPLAATVNGIGITLAEYEAELALFRAAQAEPGTNLASDAAEQVLDNLIAQTLLAQAAYEAGFDAGEEAIQTRLQNLAAGLGGTAQLQAWLDSQSLNEEIFRLLLQRAVAAGWMRDQIINAAPLSAEQVHARQIMLYNLTDAQTVLNQIMNGADFDNLAAAYDPVSGGELGWFPRGYLLEPAIEEAVFSLEAGQISEVIETRLGYHLLRVVERSPDRLLEPGARRKIQENMLRSWVETRREQSEIKIVAISP